MLHERLKSPPPTQSFQLNLQVPDKDVNYRSRLSHSYVRHVGSDSGTHLQINSNNLTPLVVAFRWKSPPNDAPHKKWEGELCRRELYHLQLAEVLGANVK